MIDIFINGTKEEFSIAQKNKIQDLFYYAIMDARSMPAFGVAIDMLVKKDIKKGVWMSIKYQTKQVINGMPFDELLINIHKGWSGFNIIRGNKGVYDGRCYYLDTNSNLDEVHKYILSSKRKNKINNGFKNGTNDENVTLLENGILSLISF